MFCFNCGSDIGNADFCPNCGAKAEQAAPQAPVIPPAAVPVTESPATSPKTEKPKKKKGKGILIAVIAVIAAIAVLLTAFFFVLKPLLEKKEDNKTETPAEDPQATPALAIDYITISERDILISEPTEALVMVGISEGDYGELTIVSAGGKQFGTVNDNGENGDQRAKDGVYSGTVTFLSDTVVSMNIHACADAARSDRFETIYFYPPYQSEYYDEYESLASEIDNVYYQYSDMEQAHNAIMELLKSKKDNGLIRDYLFEAGSIRIKLNSGYTYVYSYNPGNAYKATATDDYSGDIQTEVGLYTISPNLNSVLTMQPYRHELGAGGVDSAANTIADSDYNFIFGTDVDNSDVSVELMKRLDQYNVILLDGHGGYNSIDHSFFGVGTIITAENDKLYHVDLIYGRLIKLSGGQYGVTAAFFERHYDEGDFSDAIVYLGCCHGADDSFLANTLLSKGVDAVYAYKNSVSVSYDTRMVKEVFEQLSSNTTNPVTVSQALTTAQSIHGVTDDYRAHWYNWLFNNYETVENRARLYLFGDTNMTLSMGDSYLRGWVADAETEAPIYNAYISASKVGTSIKSGNTSTGGSGYFKFKLEPGMYDITVLATGYLNCVVTNVRVEVNATTQLQNTIMLEKRNDNPVAVVGGQVIDAVTAEPVSGAQIVFREHYNQHSGDYVKDESGNVITAVSDISGYYRTQALAYGYYTAEISKEGYVTQHVNMIASDTEELSTHQDIVLAPEASGTDFRITLEWGDHPRDLDSHIEGVAGSDNFHVYWQHQTYRNEDDVVIANLDHDDVHGNGFETVTLTVDPNGTYSYYVHRYAGQSSIAASGAIVKVYQGNVLIKQYNAPVDRGSGDYWNIFSIVNGQVVTINTISQSLPN